MDTMSMDQDEISCAKQSNWDVLLRNSIAQEKLVAEKPQGNRVDFVEPQRTKGESTLMPQFATSVGARGPRPL